VSSDMSLSRNVLSSNVSLCGKFPWRYSCDKHRHRHHSLFFCLVTRWFVQILFNYLIIGNFILLSQIRGRCTFPGPCVSVSKVYV
jgi:hypothetical protein